ncbi:MAG: FAD-binding oxidoreductase [Pseudomonadota bacterium]
MRLKSMDYTGWGRALRAKGEMTRPERRAHLERIAAETGAPALGNRRSYGDACLVNGRAAIDMSRLDRVLSFDAEAGIITIEGGLSLGTLTEIVAPLGWLPPVMPGTGYATAGGAMAMDVHGKNHHGAGSFGQHVRHATLVAPSGVREITPDGTERLFKATAGGLGQTGVIADLTLQLTRAKGDIVTVTERRIANWDDHLAALDQSEATYSVGWIDATATGTHLGRGILEEAETAAGLVPKPARAKGVPADAPAFLLSAPVVRSFNALYWRRVPASGRTVVKPIRDFFFPLDKIRDWNRLYGKRGFHQFQCVVPPGSVDALRTMLEWVARAGLASPLAVLKRMGPGRAGYMSFPMEGYTLAVDMPNTKSAERLIAALETETLDAGGRIYLAKDSLATAAAVHTMYPERASWAEEVDAVDPEGRLATDLVRRLRLRETL